MIVDIVETGTTLKENDLEVIDTIVDISARLISNKVSFKFKNRQIEKICADLRGTDLKRLILAGRQTKPAGFPAAVRCPL